MFRGGQPNPYDDIVAKATDENLTSENWELILNLCDKVVDDGEQGARNVIAAVIKRLQHRNPNVQLYSLAVVEALSKNCGIEVHREIASRSFTQALERLVTDRTAHDKVKRKTLSLIAMWTEEFEKDPSLGIMTECYENLKAKGYRFEEPDEPPPPQVDDEIRRREEEELQRVLEMSMHDKGGRANWDSYGSGSGSGSGRAANGPNGAGPSSTQSAAPSSSAAASSSQYASAGYAGSSSGYVPASSSSPRINTQAINATPAATSTYNSPTQGRSTSQTSLPLSMTSVQRVRALHSFDGTEQGELTFDKGDIIKVVDRNYKDWWRGQLRGRTGIFPVNYVELLPDPTPEEIAKEAEQEAAVFAQAANIDKLLTMLRGLDPDRDNLADNEEIQELYRTSMAVRPKIVKLIDKYNQKKAELVTMNETFVKARGMFDRMMEESLARHSGLYDGRSPYTTAPSRQDYRASMYGGAFDQPGFASFPQPQAQPNYGMSSPTPGPQTYPGVTPMYPGQQVGYTPQPYPAQQATPVYGSGPYPPDAMTPPAAQATAQPQLGQVAPQGFGQPQGQPQQSTQQATAVTQQQGANGYEAAQATAHPQPQRQASAEQAKVISGAPPFPYDPSATYADSNAQAWAQYYAQGGTDPTGAVYFFSVPGITDTKGGPASETQQMQTQPQPSQAGVEPYAVQSNSPSAEHYPAQGSSVGLVQSQGQPQLAQNLSSTSLGYTGTATQQPHSPTSSPTRRATLPSHHGSFYGVQAQQQQRSQTPGQTTQVPVSSYVYGASPFPDPGSTAVLGSEQSTAPIGNPYGVNPQFSQMQNQFAAMGVSEPRSPTGVTPALQQSV